MAAKDWRLIDEENPLPFPAKPASGRWTLARSRLPAPHALRIIADGAWTPTPDHKRRRSQRANQSRTIAGRVGRSPPPEPVAATDADRPVEVDFLELQ